MGEYTSDSDATTTGSSDTRDDIYATTSTIRAATDTKRTMESMDGRV
jgi:hypothetical protein